MALKNMKLAVVDHIGNLGGGSRFVRALLPALKECQPDMEIVFFGNKFSINRENMREEFSSVGINVIELKSLNLASQGVLGLPRSSSIIRRVQGKFAKQLAILPPFLSGAVHKEIEEVVNDFDIVLFPWPFLLELPSLKCPIISVFHDFNFKYFFGSKIYTEAQLSTLNRQVPIWLEKTIPVTGTHFMGQEISKFYDLAVDKVKVIHFAPTNIGIETNKEKAKKTIINMGITKPYVLYPTNLLIHKNIGPLLSAIYILETKGVNIDLVITGPETEISTGRASLIGVRKDNNQPNVIGLGYVTNEQMDALISQSSIVVSSSLYEEQNLPGLEAWQSGIPVAMSNIPQFIEHLELQDVRAEVFDPRSPQDIADKIHKILSNPKEAMTNALHSQNALKKLTWKDVARKYLQIFEEALFVRNL